MYTGVKNVASAALAKNFGLQKDSVFRGMTCTLEDVCLPQSLSQLPTLHPLTPQQAVEQLLPHKEQLGGYLNINHTFYRINEANCRGMASAGWVFGDGERVLVLGSRFQPTAPCTSPLPSTATAASRAPTCCSGQRHRRRCAVSLV